MKPITQQQAVEEAVRKAKHSDRIARILEKSAISDALAETVSPVIAEAAVKHGLKPRTIARIALARLGVQQ